MNHANPDHDPKQAAREAVHRSSFIAHRSSEAGFSLIELIVVVAIIGILAAIALVNVKTATTRAREAALKDDLSSMRKAIDSYYADKQKYPASLDDLVPNYMRFIPADPITRQKDWETVMDDPMSLDGQLSSETDPQAMTEPGIIDVKSRAEGATIDNVPYHDL
jgi:general secretion pathway protein G